MVKYSCITCHENVGLAKLSLFVSLASTPDVVLVVTSVSSALGCASAFVFAATFVNVIDYSPSSMASLSKPIDSYNQPSIYVDFKRTFITSHRSLQ